jgi:hypothetical protein
MKKFLVLYMVPAAGMEAWMQKPLAERQPEEDKMKTEWGTWMKTHGAMIKETAGAGKNKRVTKGGTQDQKNDIMLYSIVEAESQDEVAKIFESHPHLAIPDSWIEIMPANSLPEMGA